MVLASFTRRSSNMGSYAEATMTGFICRLCSEHKKCVIHFYSAKAQKMGLLDKLSLLPITIEKYDNLPKTICQECVDKLNLQYKLIIKIRQNFDIQRRHRTFHTNGRCPVECPLHGIDDLNILNNSEYQGTDVYLSGGISEFFED